MNYDPIPDPIGGPLLSSQPVRVATIVHAPVVDHGLTVDPDATVAQVSAALATLPVDALFTEHFGDVEVTLVFREPLPKS
ncbi:conserved hypothetical protein [Frankia canadensis]|uniref:Uncharacterized protein n=1 Tax=Frankia canadensis TaxID=1836972 RepID=A0A2I2KQ27_9ACTN|nr:conserved hypothetical protein [Frankia canadensis]SOU55054.1 conserved hypothetical protein [Frankia canadensis]